MMDNKNPAPAVTGNGANQYRQADCNPSILMPEGGFPAWETRIHNAIEQFRAAILTTGLEPPDHIELGRLVRYPGMGKRRGNTAGWCKLFEDGRGGVFGDFSTGLYRTWKLDGGNLRIDDTTRRQIEAARRERQAEIDARHAKKAVEAQAAWDRAKPCATHGYLIRKSVKSYGLRIGDWFKWLETPNGWRKIVIKDALLVPLFDEFGGLWNLQAIFPEIHPELGRDKDFMGGRKGGLFFAIGAPSDTARISEGYATGATIHAMTGDRVYIAFDAGNLPAVARTVRKLHPVARIVVCADNDRQTAGNPGVTKAREAALAVGGLVAIPEFPKGSTATDWNDWYQLNRFPGSLDSQKQGISPLASPLIKEARHG